MHRVFSFQLVIVSWCWGGQRQRGGDEPRPGVPVKRPARDSYLL